MKDKFDSMADEADAFSDEINSANKPDAALIKRGLRNSYDVIVSEALDHIITHERTQEFLEEVMQAVNKQKSYLVVGRARLVAAMADSDQLRSALAYNESKEDPYYKIWLNAAKAIETRQPDCLRKLMESAEGQDKTISSLSTELIAFLKKRGIA